MKMCEQHNPLVISQKSVQKKQGFEILSLKKENPRAVQGGLGRRPILLIIQKSVQKKQGFEILSSKKENPRAVQGGLGRRPILKKGSWTS